VAAIYSKRGKQDRYFLRQTLVIKNFLMSAPTLSSSTKKDNKTLDLIQRCTCDKKVIECIAVAAFLSIPDGGTFLILL
jgi:hypothetical protein